MEIPIIHTKTYKVLVFSGSALLILMAVFHASGINYVTEIVMESNADDLIKEIFPVLFLHTSLHLFGLAMFGLATLYLKTGYKNVLMVIASLIVVSAFAAFYLNAVAPGILLLVAASCFILAVCKK